MMTEMFGCVYPVSEGVEEVIQHTTLAIYQLITFYKKNIYIFRIKNKKYFLSLDCGCNLIKLI